MTRYAVGGELMKQRASRSEWFSPRRSGHRPRLLVEDDSLALAISDFSLFHAAGFDVAFCSGSGDDSQACPVMHGQPCPLLPGADGVLHGLDPELGIAAAIRRQYPRLAVVIEQRRDEDGARGERCVAEAFSDYEHVLGHYAPRVRAEYAGGPGIALLGRKCQPYLVRTVAATSALALRTPKRRWADLT